MESDLKLFFILLWHLLTIFCVTFIINSYWKVGKILWTLSHLWDLDTIFVEQSFWYFYWSIAQIHIYFWHTWIQKQTDAEVSIMQYILFCIFSCIFLLKNVLFLYLPHKQNEQTYCVMDKTGEAILCFPFIKYSEQEYIPDMKFCASQGKREGGV